MSRGCRIALKSSSTDLPALKVQVRDLLRSLGLEYWPKRSSEDSFTITGKSNRWLSMLQSFVPFLDFLGPLSRVRATIKAVRLDGVTTLFVSVDPFDEALGEDERLFIAQDPEEMIGDHWNARRWFRRLVAKLHEEGLVVERAAKQPEAGAALA